MELEEYCPCCSGVTNFNLKDAVCNCGTVKCEHCGSEILTCSVCSHRMSGKHCDESNCFEYKKEE